MGVDLSVSVNWGQTKVLVWGTKLRSQDDVRYEGLHEFQAKESRQGSEEQMQRYGEWGAGAHGLKKQLPSFPDEHSSAAI